MASAYTPARTGQVNSANSTTALFKDKWSQEIITSFYLKNKLLALTDTRMARGSKSVSFPVFGTATAAYHVPGAELNGQTINQNERLIYADQKMVADVFIDGWDEVIEHFDARAPFTEALSEALAAKTDKNIAQLIGLAARAAATVTGGSAGSALTYANARTIGADLGAAIYEAAQKMDEKGVPEEGRNCLVRPAQYNLLVQSVNMINQDWGGRGSYADGKILSIGGVNIVKTMHLPITDLSASVTGENNTYVADFQNTAALVFHKSTVGNVRWQGVNLGTEYSERHQGTLVVAKQIIGHGILRPESAVEIKVA